MTTSHGTGARYNGVYYVNQSNLRVSWQQVHQNYHSIMSHQADGDRASITTFSPQTHHNKPDEHKEKEDDDFPRSLEEALLGE